MLLFSKHNQVIILCLQPASKKRKTDAVNDIEKIPGMILLYHIVDYITNYNLFAVHVIIHEQIRGLF